MLPGRRERFYGRKRSPLRAVCICSLFFLALVFFFNFFRHGITFHASKDKGEKSVSRGRFHVGKTTTLAKASFPLTYKLLSSQNSIPALGFGTAGLGSFTKKSVAQALTLGYRLIDSAQAREWYREDLVGEALESSTVPRGDLFLVSKIHPRHLGLGSCRRRVQQSLDDLRTDYLDLLLIHYPACFQPVCDPSEASGTWQECWAAMEEMYDKRIVRSIGVSNFGEQELLSLLSFARIPPAVLQRNSDPLRADKALQELCKQRNVTYMGYSTLGSQWQFSQMKQNPVLTHPIIMEISTARSCTPAQVALKWALEKGQVVIPRSSNPKHMKENFEAPNCALSKDDVMALDVLDGEDPLRS